MHEHPEQERKSTFFLLSLLLHLLLFYICFLFISYHKSSKTVANRLEKAQKELSSPGSREQASPTREQEATGDKEKEPKKEEPKKEKEELAELKARQSAFGAPVVFAEMPESTPTVASNEKEDDDAERPETEPLTKSEEKAEEKQEITIAKKEKPQDQRELDPHAISLQALHKIVESKVESKQESKELLKETIAALENKERKVIRRPAPRAKTTTAYNEGNAQRSAGPTNKKFTFADLANGFLENLQSGGKDLINQRGNPNKRPGIEQLKQASYRQKMAWSLQAAFKRAARRTTFIQPVPDFSALELTFYITKEGELENLVVNSPTGHQELDAYIVKTVKDAFPLPPIPDHWKEEMLTQTWVFRNIRPDESSYMVNF